MKSSVLDSPPSRGGVNGLVAGVGAGALHVVGVVVAVGFGTGAVVRGVQPAVSELVEVALPAQEPTPPKAPEEPPATKAPAAEKRAEPSKPQPVARNDAPPPEAAKAGQVLTAPADVVDFGDTFVSGAGKGYVGGVTQTNGTAEHAVRDANARALGVEGGTGKVLDADRSRPPALAGGFTWDCPFPAEADDAGVDNAVVGLRVEVSASGDVVRVTATSDPGNGFAREARRCAKSKRWSPGLDAKGAPQPAVAIVRVRFAR